MCVFKSECVCVSKCCAVLFYIHYYVCMYMLKSKCIWLTKCCVVVLYMLDDVECFKFRLCLGK